MSDGTVKSANNDMAKLVTVASPDEGLQSTSHPVADSSNKKIATEIQIRESIAAVRDALEKRWPQQPNTWVFFSNRNKQLLTILGDLPFIQCVLLEGDPNVASYRAMDTDSQVDAEGYSGRVKVTWDDGRQDTYRCVAETRQPRAAPTKNKPVAVAAASTPTSEIIVTERDLSLRMVEFANWLMLSGAMTRARSFSTAHESSLLVEAIASKNGIAFDDAMKLPNVDPALMLAAIATGLANGVLACNLKDALLDINRRIALNANQNQVEKRSQSVTNPSPVEPTFVAMSMPRNRRTKGHPELFVHPERWLVFEEPELPETNSLRCRAKAVQLYIHNRPYAEIRRETGISAAWVRKLFGKTLEANPGESPRGIKGLVRYRHWGPNTRHADLPAGNLAEGRRGGYAGAFTSLVSRFPEELMEMIEGEVLKNRRDHVNNCKRIREARVSWIDLHGRFREFLLAKGMGKDHYPFNTRDEAYSSLVTLCNAILFNRPLNWISSRGGEDAVRRTNIGQGLSSLIRPQWLNQICELDYQKGDSAAIVEISTPKGTSIDVPVPRWWAGAIVETYSESIIATSDSFEFQTTEDCLMELVDLAVVTPAPMDQLKRFKASPDGRWLPGHFLQEFAGQAWDILKIDRAWAHKSTTALSAIVATVGCALCYGEARAWYARYLVERTFEKLTQAGPQNLPSTFGTGPKDTKKGNPDQEALRWRFRQDDICDLIKLAARWVNTTGDEGNFWAKPLEVIQAAMADSSQRFFPRPYPKLRQKDRPTMWHMLPCKVEGNALKGIEPCVRVNRTRFRGPQLAHSWNLIRQKVFLQVYRRQFQISRVLSANGELVGYVKPEKKWMTTALSWRDHNLIQKFGQIAKRHEREPTPTHDFLEVKQAELTAEHAAHKSKPTQRKKDATAVARIRRNAKLQGPVHGHGTSDQLEQPTLISSEPNSVLGPAPLIGAIVRRKHRG
ncbi:MAG: hypothetical protein ABIK82_03255 [Pseudomonadota bacterium]